MTDIYFVRHCQSVSGWKDDDSTRPLTERGEKDSALVTLTLSDTKLDYCVCSPYKRSMCTVGGCAAEHKLAVNTDARFGERRGGADKSGEMLVKRWEDFSFHEDGGESIGEVQRRNIEGLEELLLSHEGESILFGTHGTALSAILNHYEPDFALGGFYRIYNWMPYIIRATFDGTSLVSRKDILIVNRGY